MGAPGALIVFMTHAAALGTQRGAVGVKDHVGIRGKVRMRGFRVVVRRVAVDGNNGANPFDATIVVEGQGVMLPVADEDVDVQGQVVLLKECVNHDCS